MRAGVVVEAILRAALILGTAGMLVVVLASVVSRFALASPLIWSDEATRFLLVWISFLGAGLATRDAKELAARELAMLLPPATLRIVELGIAIASLAFLVVFVIAGIRMLPVAHDNVSEILEVPYSVIYLAAPLGGAIMATYLGLRLRASFRRPRPPGNPSDR